MTRPVSLHRLTHKEKSFVWSRDTCRIATVDRIGWPHCVPVGYLYKGGNFYIPANRKSKKVVNIRRNSFACIVIDDEPPERGLMLQGRVVILEGERFRKLARWMGSKTGWTTGSESVMLVLSPEKKVSWGLR